MIFSVLLTSITLFFPPENNFIEWKENYTLKFVDFKAKAKKTPKPQGELAIKASWTISETDGTPPVYKIYNRFDPNSSWMSINHNELLKEYQFIWNLHELYIRKARKEVSNLNKKKVFDYTIYDKAIRKNITQFQKQRMKYDGVIQNQKDLYNIVNKKYLDSLNMYKEYKQ